MTRTPNLQWPSVTLKNVLLLFSIVGCATTRVSENTRIQLQTRLFPDTQVDPIFNHLKNTLSQYRYTIKSAEAMDGTIVASRNLPNLGGSTERREEIIVNLTQIPKGVKSQVSIQTILHYSLGGSLGKEVLERQPYEEFYSRANKNRDGDTEDDRVPTSVRIEK